MNTPSNSVGNIPSQSPQSIDVLRKRFSLIDTDRSGYLELDEIIHIFSTPQFTFPITSAKILIRRFSKTNKLDFQSFCEMDAFILHVTNIFKTCDTDRSGTIDASEISNCMYELGYNLTAPTIKSLMVTYDQQNTGCLSYSGFLAMASLCELARHLFSLWNPQSRGTLQGTLTIGFEALLSIALWFI